MKKSIFGKILIVGRTNVGKSTLLNQLINANISIISRKPNTTQTHITGIYTDKLTQFELIDSPGIKNKYSNIEKKKLRDTFNLIQEVHIIIFLINCFIWTNEETKLLEYIKKNNSNYIIVINKIDCIKKKKLLLPFIYKINQLTLNHEIFLISAKKNIYLKNLLIYINEKLPISSHKHLNNQKTNCTKKFLISEIIRNTLMNLVNKEIVYSFTVEIFDFYRQKNEKYFINSIVFVKNKRHKKIIIGYKGKKINQCKEQSQYKIEKLLEKKIYFKILVKIK
ncbi:GTPase Era [Buchnera aphidicola (Cinara kochiana kochiana)]|uniref:GTPase Era n=1 Tax=Buchnera aphidicola (Cinara kochiana kochiana) TaxID=2518976 RepID=A0A451D5L9_9GAMM|nr:GTPase Era [Buchnera aphidicola]VFP81083.1 GTPase Era [Buchnera aphidicola (Cinara kochiana kochiana)]